MAAKVTVRTDGKWKNFKYRDEVPKKVLRDQFDWLDEEDGFDGFILYKGIWYHLSQFMRLSQSAGELKGWDGYVGDSYFSGVVIKVSSDGEQYMIGTYIS